MSQSWSGVAFSWLPFTLTPPIRPEIEAGRFCLGNRCWLFRQLQLADAREIVEILLRRSWPLTTASKAAAVLYARGFLREARILRDAYGKRFSVERVERQINAVYQSWTEM